MHHCFSSSSVQLHFFFFKEGILACRRGQSGRGLCLFGTTRNTQPPPHLYLTLFFPHSNDFLLEERDERNKKEKENRKTAGSKHLTGGCRHPHPVVCRPGSGALGQSASSPSVYLRVCQIWLRRCPFPSWPSLEEVKHLDFTAHPEEPSAQAHNGALNPLSTQQRHKSEQRRKNVLGWVVSWLFPLIFTAAEGEAKHTIRHSGWHLAFHLKVLQISLWKNLLCVAWQATAQIITTSKI